MTFWDPLKVLGGGGRFCPPHAPPLHSRLWRERHFYLWKCQKESQEDQGEVKELGGTPLAVIRSPGPPGLPSGSPLDPLELHQTSLREALQTDSLKKARPF